MNNGSEPELPDAEVLEHFRVRPLSSLGGRLNGHWLVERGRDRLVLRRWSAQLAGDEIDYEIRLLRSVAALGWPVAEVVEGPVEFGGHAWSLSPFIPGEPPAADNPLAEQRARGRLLAQFHADLKRLDGFGQRGNWRRCEEILGDTSLDRVLAETEKEQPENVRLLRWHLERARDRIEGMRLPERPDLIVHGDFTPWNLRFRNGRLTGILDFELAHRDHRVGDFALSWRGKYDEIVHGYNEVALLEPEEWELITPLWWAMLIELGCRHLAEGTLDDGWIARKLLERSPLMGRDAVAYRG